MLTNIRIMKTFAKILLLLKSLMNFMSLNLNLNFHASNGNVPGVFKAGHLNWGGGKLFSKIDDDDVQPRRMYKYVASNFRFRKKFDVESDFWSRPSLV